MARQPLWTAIASTTAQAYDATLIPFPCRITSILIQTDGSNDPTVAFYDNTAASGTQALPTSTFDASALGLNGATGLDIECKTALHITISMSGGAAKVFINYV